jgi:tRNA threonylcarbamoyladenosine biosynthesis protein TsaB
LQVGSPEQVNAPAASRLLTAGNAFEAYGQQLQHLSGERLQALPTAAALLRLAPALLAAGQAVPAEQAMPLYIRDKVAQTTAEREAAKAKLAATPSGQA